MRALTLKCAGLGPAMFISPIVSGLIGPTLQGLLVLASQAALEPLPIQQPEYSIP
jgi:hypothetical protein